MKISDYFEVVFLVALAVAFFIATLKVSGILGWLQANAKYPVLHKLFSCDHCLSFWIAVIVCIGLSSVNPLFLLIPMFSTPISKILI